MPVPTPCLCHLSLWSTVSHSSKLPNLRGGRPKSRFIGSCSEAWVAGALWLLSEGGGQSCGTEQLNLCGVMPAPEIELLEVGES